MPSATGARAKKKYIRSTPARKSAMFSPNTTSAELRTDSRVFAACVEANAKDGVGRASTVVMCITVFGRRVSRWMAGRHADLRALAISMTFRLGKCHANVCGWFAGRRKPLQPVRLWVVRCILRDAEPVGQMPQTCHWSWMGTRWAIGRTARK